MHRRTGTWDGHTRGPAASRKASPKPIDGLGGDAQGGIKAERALALDKQNLVYLASLGHAYAVAGMKDQARATLARLQEAARDRHVSAYHVAAIHVALGDADAGMDWLERAYEERSPWIAYLRVDPRVEKLREEPRFKRLLAKTRLLS